MTDPRPHDIPPTRRARRGDSVRTARDPARRRRLVVGVLAAAVLVLGSATAVVGALTAGALAGDESRSADAAASDLTDAVPPATITALPAPAFSGAASGGQSAEEGATSGPCALTAVTTALAAGDDAAVVAAVGGGDGLRAAIASGAPCLSLSDPARLWTVVNKTRPYQPADYAPAHLTSPTAVRDLDGSGVRSDAATALDALAAAARAEGAGGLGMVSGYRSYQLQEHNFGQGGSDVEVSVARPGYSEHQSGLAADVVACDAGGCSGMDDFAGTPQGQWVAANSWRFGWIVRYEKGETPITGYMPEPWHLRYVGTRVAEAYHDGGWHTLEEFFGLPAAPTY